MANSPGRCWRSDWCCRSGARPTTETGRTLVFDEVDAGIGGAAAQAIGDALAELGRHHQVLVVTHLAQVAAAAANQISVAKSVHDGQTFTTAEPDRR